MLLLIMRIRRIRMYALARHIQMGAIERPAVQHQCCLGGRRLFKVDRGGLGCGVVLDRGDPASLSLEVGSAVRSSDGIRRRVPERTSHKIWTVERDQEAIMDQDR
jgi:hypothetical protein